MVNEKVRTGLDILRAESCGSLDGMRVGLLANPASVTVDLVHAAEVLHGAGVELACLFGPQHGYRGDTQANMIEWEGYTHPELGVPVYSLYGERREPSGEMLATCDRVLIDLPDIGARPYTYLWTAVLMMRSCAGTGVSVTVLDRPNPIGGAAVEGPMLDIAYRSFVGLFPLPMRHGLTIGEALGMVHREEELSCRLDIVRMTGWRRDIHFEETDLVWIPPSPNVPIPRTALLYPGVVLLEGTNLSEGRGTTRPFEIVGAPWIEPGRFARELSARGQGGAIFRPLFFRPTWDKYAGTTCGGVQIHVTDPTVFTPVRCGAAVIAAAASLYPERFEWIDPPYEYEYRLPPIDVISGSDSLRNTIDSGGDIDTLMEKWKDDESSFRERRKPYLLY